MKTGSSFIGLFLKIRDIGVPEDMRPEEAKFIRMINIAVLFFTLTLLPWMIFQLAHLHITIFVIQALMMVATLPVLRFNHKGRYTLARVHLSVIAHLFLVFMCIVSAGALVTHYFFFIAAGCMALGFPRDETKWMVTLITLFRIQLLFIQALVLQVLVVTVLVVPQVLVTVLVVPQVVL